jgi:uncharacterized membrane protein
MEELEYKNIKFPAILAWCQANGQVAWLKAEMKKQVPYKIYPKVEVDGKMVADKTATPKIEMHPITFIQVRNDFVATFMPEIAPKKKEKQPTMYELVEAL